MSEYLEEDKIPEKWCIKANIKTVGKYFNKQSNCHWYYPVFKNGYLHRFDCLNKKQDITVKGNYNSTFHSSWIIDGYTEITYEQFQKYVLNKKTSVQF